MKRQTLATIAWLLALLAPYVTAAQTRIGVMYYDLDRLYDTLPSPFYDDSAYTPGGASHWDTARYRRKIRHTAAVLDSMRMPLAALCGVENEAVVRDLVEACEQDYCYVHRTLNSLNGMDFALLYYGDLFFPDHVESGRSYLYVEGRLRTPPAHASSDRIGLLLADDTRYAAWAVGELRAERPGVQLLVLGRNTSICCQRTGLRNASARAEQAGYGNVRYRSGWRMRDRVLADTALHTSGAAVYVRCFLFDSRRGEPLPTFEQGIYRGGYSRSLPVFVYLE